MARFYGRIVLDRVTIGFPFTIILSPLGPSPGGVVVEGDTVYAAAGITHYDGTHVVALDAVTGELKASNTTSGTLEEEVNNGISMQGNLMIVDGELRFLAGGVYETARYDLQTLQCLNTPKSKSIRNFAPRSIRTIRSTESTSRWTINAVTAVRSATTPVTRAVSL